MQSHLESQFERIFTHFAGKKSQTTLQHLAEVLCCTKRNARVVLNKLTEQGWLSWQPVAGRGNKSALTFFCSNEELKLQRAFELLSEGNYQAALHQLDNNSTKLTQLLIDRLGVVNHNGSTLLRLASLAREGTSKPFQSSDSLDTFVQQLIFSGLTKINRLTGKLEADLAHQWHKVTNLHWRFYLRANIYWQDGSKLSCEDVVVFLLKLIKLPLFSHIQEVHSPFPCIIDIFLSAADEHLPFLLAEPEAKLAQYKKKEKSLQGTGPFCLAKKDGHKLSLKKSPYFFGAKSLIDEIEIWFVNQQHFSFDLNKAKLNVNQRLMQQLDGNEKSLLENGAIFLWLNRRAGRLKQHSCAVAISHMLSPLQLMAHMDDIEDKARFVPAWSLLPNCQLFNSNLVDISFDQPDELTLACPKNQPLLFTIALLIQKILKQHYIELDIQLYAHESVINFAQHKKVDLWLDKLALEHLHQESSIFWLLRQRNLSNIMQPDVYQTLKQNIAAWRMKADGAQEKDLFNALHSAKQVLPLFHLWRSKEDIFQRLSSKLDDELLSFLWQPPKL